MTSDEEFDPASLGWQEIIDTGFLGLVGPVWQRKEEDGLALAFMAAAKHRNRRGVVQGGMLATLLDRAIGLNVSEANGHRPQATLQLDVHYLEVVKLGDFIEARCRIERRTKSVTFATGTAFVGPRAVATARGVWKILGEH